MWQYLLPVCAKLFELLICRYLHEFFIENDLMSSNCSGFKQADSFIYQLLSVTYELISQKLSMKFETKFSFSKLDFKDHVKNMLNKICKTVGLLRKLQKYYQDLL